MFLSAVSLNTIALKPFIAIFKIHVLFIDHQTYISEILKNIVYFGVSR